MIEFDPERARWRQIAADIRGRIAADEYRAGARLPSEQDLAQMYGVSRTTIRRVIDALKAEGLAVVEQRPGHPRATYVRGPVQVETITLRPGDQADYRGTGTVVVTRADGQVETYPADAVRIVGEGG